MKFVLVFTEEGSAEVYPYIFRNLDRWAEAGETNMKLLSSLVNMTHMSGS